MLVSSTEIPTKTCSSLGTIATVTVDDLNNIELIQIPTSSAIENSMVLADESSTQIDKTEFSDSLELQTDIESMGMDSISIVNEDANIQSLELIDCQIELMDQFNLTDHIELSNDAIQLQGDDDYLVDNICDMPDFLNIYQNTIMVEDELDVADATAESIRPVASKRRKVTHKARKSGSASAAVNLKAVEECDDDDVRTDAEISEPFTSWLDSVIEAINVTNDYAGDGCPEPLVFRIPHVRKYYLIF